MSNRGHTGQGTKGMTMQRGVCYHCFRSVGLTRNRKTGEWYYRPHKDTESEMGRPWCLAPGGLRICPPGDVSYGSR